MKILITGANGQLGTALQHVLTAHDIVALDHAALDITDQKAVHGAIERTRPDVVINCAALTDTAACERDGERAAEINGKAPLFVSTGCIGVGATLVQISTNEVFDGRKGTPYDEDDKMSPINAYGVSKFSGEALVKVLPHLNYYIVRTSWTYGPGRASFPEKILLGAREKGRLRLVTDEIATPTLTIDLAAAIAKLIETREFGTYHLTNEGECSRMEWAEEVLRLAGVDVPIEGITLAEYGSPVRKPTRSTLANNRAAALGITLRPWREALRDHMRAVARARA